MKKFWEWLNGKKLIISTFYWETGAAILLIWFPEGLPTVYNKVWLSIGIFLTGIGLGHKAVKQFVGSK